MGFFSYVPGGTGEVENTYVADQAWVDQQANPAWYIDVSSEDPMPGPGWTYNGSSFAEPVPPPAEPSYMLTGTQWVERFTDAEWKWIKTRREDGTAAGDRLDQMMDAIRWTNSVDVSTPQMDEFYTWLLAEGIPGGQTRIDELRAAV